MLVLVLVLVLLLVLVLDRWERLFLPLWSTRLASGEDATGLRKVILHTSRSTASTSTVRGCGLSTNTMCSDRIPGLTHVKQAAQYKRSGASRPV
ncbi:MAG: hypothetical protein ACK6DC_03020 [Planctomycetota bacterium]